MTIEDWLASACVDVDRRGLPELKPLLSALADATRALRAADWNESPSPPGLASPSATRNRAFGTRQPAQPGDESPRGDGGPR